MIRRQPHGEETLRLSLPAPELELGTPPRLCYPLVIFLTRKDNRDPHPDETVRNLFVFKTIYGQKLCKQDGNMYKATFEIKLKIYN